MTKAQVVDVLMEKTGLTRPEAIEAFEAFLESVREGLRRGERVSLVGFGSFYTKEQRARNGRNPRTGQPIAIPEKRVTVFRPGRAFRVEVNDGKPVGGADDEDDE